MRKEDREIHVHSSVVNIYHKGTLTWKSGGNAYCQ